MTNLWVFTNPASWNEPLSTGVPPGSVSVRRGVQARCQLIGFHSACVCCFGTNQYYITIILLRHLLCFTSLKTFCSCLFLFYCLIVRLGFKGPRGPRALGPLDAATSLSRTFIFSQTRGYFGVVAGCLGSGHLSSAIWTRSGLKWCFAPFVSCGFRQRTHVAPIVGL